MGKIKCWKIITDKFLNKKKIAKTSRTPGRTRSMVIFEYKNLFRIIDLPGYGFSRISKEKVLQLDKLIDKYLRKRINLKNIFLLIDSRHLLKSIDRIIIDLLHKSQKRK